MSAHVVVPVEPCGKRWRCPDYQHRVDCLGCLGDGTRAVLDDAVPVERAERSADAQWWRSEL